MVATVAFETAAARQAEALGFRPAVRFVPHPIQNRTPDELEAIAVEALPGILAAITTDPAHAEAQ